MLCALPAIAGPVTGSVRLLDRNPAGRRSAGDYSGVVVWLEPLNGAGAGLAIHPKTAQMAQKKKHFDPPVLAIPVGSTVTFPNLDPIFHNAFSNYSGQIFDVGLYPPSAIPKVVFSRPGIVRVFCNIHPTMSAVIVVLNTPWFAVSNTNGAFRIADVPPADYRLKLFHERALADELGKLERQITVGPDELALPVMTISEVGYVAPPHKNKFGKDYPPVIVDQYPGKR